MESGDPDAPTSQKRPRLDSVNPAYNGLPPPPHAQPSRHPPHPTAAAQASSPPPTRYHPHPQPHSHPHPPPPPPPPPPPHSNLPHPSHPFQGPGPAHYQGQHPIVSPSPLPPSDIRAYSDPRNIPSPGQRTNGLPNPPVIGPPRNITQDSIATYRPSLIPQSAPEHPDSRPASVVDVKLQQHTGMEPGQWPQNPDHRHHGSIPNGNGYPNQSPPHEQPFTPPLAQQHYVQPGNAYPPGPYMPPQYQGQQAHIRRKQVRATQACNHCRSRKQKCDEQRPCQFCRENSFDCQYKDVPPPKQDRSMMQLQDSVNSIGDTLKVFLDRFDSWQHSVESRLPQHRPGETMNMGSHHASPDQGYAFRGSMSDQNGSRMPTPIQGRTQMQRVNSMKHESPNIAYSHMSPAAANASTPVKQELILGPPQQPATPADSVGTDHTTATGDARKEEKKGLQSDHTTAAHQLLEEWPSLKEMCANMDQIREMKAKGQLVSDYPMLLEQERGLVRVWGIGEGNDLHDGTHAPVTPKDGGSDASSPRPLQDGLWGTGDHSSPGTMNGDTPRDFNEQVGGLNGNGRLELRSKVMWDLHESYLLNIHSLHPFVNPSSLRKMIADFSDKYSPERTGANVMSPGSAIPNHLNPGIKRKRSSSSFTDPYSPARDSSTVSIERSLSNAIVLLVLALGKVCSYTDPLPAPDNDKGPITLAPWGSSRDSLHSTSNSFGENFENRKRNIDMMPGMAYFSYATDILGNQQGGNTVAHAQAMLLAALYLGQFARVLESWSWINNACRICLILIKSDMSKIERKTLFDNSKPKPQYSVKENYRLNLVKCVYWTCLQLETDILAELSSLPPSDISTYQATVSYPSGVFERFPDDFSYDDGNNHDKTMWIYSSLIHLRVILNEAHNTLYSPNDRKRPPGFDVKDLHEVAKAARLHADILSSWRRLLPPTLAWKDHEPPSRDINIARLRAKFYGGHYMILRPFLFLAVHDVQLPQGPQVAWSSQANSPAGNMTVPSIPTNPGLQRSLMNPNSEQADILIVAHKCINSAIQSTIAFDRVGEPENSDTYIPFQSIAKRRLIVTNIFGTLHAQFGNMLVLAAVFNSDLRRHLPDTTTLTRQNLSHLYRRTINILDQVAPNSPVLAMDRDILIHIQRTIGLH